MELWRKNDVLYSIVKPFKNPTNREKYVFRYFGDAPIIFTAPHGVRHCREDGKVYPAEIGTSGLAEAMAEVHKGISICTISRDVYTETTGPIKDCLLGLGLENKLVVDIHGMSDKYGVDVSIGTEESTDTLTLRLAEILETDAAKLKLQASLNYPFSALSPKCISHFVHKNRGIALQLEIALSLRTFKGNLTKNMALISLINRMVEEYLKMRE